MRQTKWLATIGKVSLLVACWCASAVAQGQKVAAPAMQPAPVPAQIANAKSVFISNTAPDGMPSDMLESYGEPNRAYDQLYADIKAWGRYQMADAPSNADLVMEIHFRRSTVTGGQGEGAEFYVSVLDEKSHFVLWTFVEPVKGAIRKVSWEKNMDDSVRSLVDDLKLTIGALPQPNGN